MSTSSKAFRCASVMCPSVMSLSQCLLTRALGFFHSCLDSPSHEVKVMARLSARDLRSNLGSNISLIESMTGGNPWTMNKYECKKFLRAREKSGVPPADTWRLSYLWRLLTERLEAYYRGEDDNYKRLTILIDSLVIN